MEWVIQPSGKEMERRISDRIEEFNKPFFEDYESLSQHILDENGTCIAGIVANRCGELISVDLLWVNQSHRKQGLGEALLSQVERLGQEKGGKRVYLFTFAFQAPDFYPKLGYQLLFRLEAGPTGNHQFHYAKELV